MPCGPCSGSYDPENYRRVPVTGRDGFDLADFFAREPLQAYEGVSLPQLPNMFMIFGPYSWTGSSWHVMVETQSHHAVRVIKEARRRGATMVAVRPEAHERFLRFVRARSQQLLVHNNCGAANTYYFDHHGGRLADAPHDRARGVVDEPPVLGRRLRVRDAA